MAKYVTMNIAECIKHFVDVKVKPQNMAKKRVKAPAGYHWMKKGAKYILMKHPGTFVPHKGASLFAPFDIMKKHKKNG